MIDFGKKSREQIAVLRNELAPLQEMFSALKRNMAMIEFSADGTILEANASFCRIMGYGENEIKGMHHSALCAPGYVGTTDYKEFWNRLRKGESFSGKFQRFNKKGEVVWLEATYFPVPDHSGQVSRVIKLASDITRRVNEENFYRNMIAALDKSMAVIEFDMQGNIIRANTNFLSLMGYRPDEVEGRQHRMFCRGEFTSSPEYRTFWEKLNHGEFFSGQYERVTKSGETVWLEATYNPIIDEHGKPCRVIKFAADVTENVLRHQAEAESARMAYEVSLETEQVATNGEQIILQTTGKMRTLSDRVKASSTQVKSLGDKTSRITQIVNTIKEIADQTNLLALNAAIEAARAGESGRGFAVVADEVRKLAERTARSTEEISGMISSIQGESRSVIDSMEHSLAEVEEGEHLASGAGAAIQQIRAGAQKVVDAVRQFSETLD